MKLTPHFPAAPADDGFDDLCAGLRAHFPALEEIPLLDPAHVTAEPLATAARESLETATSFYWQRQDKKAIFIYRGHDKARFLGQGASEAQETALTLFHETGHALIMAARQRHSDAPARHECLADAFAALLFARHFGGRDLHRLRHLAARRAVQLVLSGDDRDIEHFTAPAVLAAIGYAARKPLSDLPAEELADIARALVAGAEDALRPDDVYDICNYYRPVQRDILHATSGDAALIGEAFGDNRPVTLAQAMHAFADHVAAAPTAAAFQTGYLALEAVAAGHVCQLHHGGGQRVALAAPDDTAWAAKVAALAARANPPQPALKIS